MHPTAKIGVRIQTLRVEDAVILHVVAVNVVLFDYYCSTAELGSAYIVVDVQELSLRVLWADKSWRHQPEDFC